MSIESPLAPQHLVIKELNFYSIGHWFDNKKMIESLILIRDFQISDFIEVNVCFRKHYFEVSFYYSCRNVVSLIVLVQIIANPSDLLVKCFSKLVTGCKYIDLGILN